MLSQARQATPWRRYENSAFFRSSRVSDQAAAAARRPSAASVIMLTSVVLPPPRCAATTKNAGRSVSRVLSISVIASMIAWHLPTSSSATSTSHSSQKESQRIPDVLFGWGYDRQTGSKQGIDSMKQTGLAIETRALDDGSRHRDKRRRVDGPHHRQQARGELHQRVDVRVSAAGRSTSLFFLTISQRT